MPSTACTTPSSVENSTRRSCTLSSGSCAFMAPSGPCEMASRVAHPRVQEGVGDVHDDVREDDEQGRQQHRALDDREVRVGDRDVVETADPGNVEDGFD